MLFRDLYTTPGRVVKI